MKRECLDGESIFVISDFLSSKECRELIEQSEAIGYETFTIDGEAVPGFRNNARAFLVDGDLAEKLWARARAFIPAELEDQAAAGLSPRFRFYRYRGEEAFVPHHDGSISLNDCESKLTFMIYLSDVAKGGETRFYGPGPTVRFSVCPERGKALVFDHVILHEGVAVKEGCKYVVRTDVMYAIAD